MGKNDTNKIRKKSKNVMKLIRKSNELVEARYKFDIWETRVFTKMLTMVQRNDKDFQEYRIYLKDIVRDFGIENNNDAYDRLRAGGYKLMSKIIKVIRETDEGLMELATPMVVGVQNLLDTKSEGAKFIDVSFHPEMRPFLLSLKSKFTTYDVRNILKLPSSYSIRIYELLKQYEKIGRRKFGLQELKEIIGVIEEVDYNGKKTYKDNYPLFGNFKQRVLLKAERDLKKSTDIYFTFDPRKTGRKVTHIIFDIFPNPKNMPKEDIELIIEEVNGLDLTKEDKLVATIYPLVKKWVSKTVVESWVTTLPEAQIKKGIDYTLSQLKSGKSIKNVAGYLQKMVRMNDLKDAVSEQKQQVRYNREKEKVVVERSEKLKQQLNVLMKELRTKENAIIAAIFLEFPDAEVQIVEKAKQRTFSGYDLTKSEMENKKSPIFNAAIRNTLLETYAARFKALHQQYEPEIKALKRAVKAS